MQQQEQNDDALTCPSFNSYTGDGLAAIAAKVTGESQNFESFGDDDDFEFSIVLDDELVIAENQILPVFPVFNRDLSKNDGNDCVTREDGEDVSSIRIPLKKLFGEDRDERRPSTSSSEGDEMEALPAGSYCVWKPKYSESPSPSRWKKSPSTGSRSGSGSGSGSGSKRWRLRDLLLRRSNSDGKGPFVFLTPNHREEKTEKTKNVHDFPKQKNDSVRKVKAGVASPSPTRSSPHEVFYVRNRAEKEEGKRKSYLPYRRDLVGFFASVHGMGKPF